MARKFRADSKRPGILTPVDKMYEDPEKYAATIAEYEETVKEYRRIAKRADQRLVRLEKYSNEAGFHEVKRWAYANALDDIKRFSGEEAKRFNTAPPATIMQVESKINAMKRFLDAPTATKSGILRVYKKRADTINKRFGTSFTWSDVANYYNSGLADKLSKDYGSKTALYAIANAQKQFDQEEIDKIKSVSEDKKIVSDEMIQTVVDDMMSKYAVELQDLLSHKEIE